MVRVARPAPSGDCARRRTLIALSLAGSLAAAPPALLDQAGSFLASVWNESGRLGIRTLDELAAQSDATLQKAGLDELDIRACRAAAEDSGLPD